MDNKYKKFTKEELIQKLEKFESRKKYGLIWDEEKTKEKFEKDAENALPVLKEIKGKEIKTSNKSLNNILIEGDNYHALSVLNFTHQGKIDVIYIDPPYNTGSGDFKYNDKYVDKEDTYRHSKWLSFMSKRLKLAKKLLSKKGVIFISINDIEMAQLRILCDEIFGEKNFITTLIWEKHKAPKNDNNYITINHEYILMFARQKEKFVINKLPRSEKNLKSFSNPDNDTRGSWISGPLLAPTFNQSTVFPINKPDGNNILPPDGKCWAFSEKRIIELIADNRIWFGKDGKNVPRIKRFLSELSENIGVTSILLHDELAGTQKASNDLKKIFEGRKLFDYPKPVEVLKRLLFISTKKESIILDFFAGSGTTGQAVMELNKNDEGKRKFILCTNNENNNGMGLKIATDICYPRIKKNIKGYKNAKCKNCIKGLGGNLKYYKTAFVKNAISRDEMKTKITQQCTEMLCLRESIFDEIKSIKSYKIFQQDNKIMAIYYSLERNRLDSLKKSLDKLEGDKILYCFTLDHLGLEKSDFIGWDNIQLEPIPQKILDIYKDIYEY